MEKTNIQKQNKPIPEQESLRIKLSITTNDAKKFIDELERLCNRLSIEKDYFFKFG